MPASARRRRFRKVPIHGSCEGKTAPIFYPNLWFLRGQDGSNLLPRKGIVGVGFTCRTFSARLLSDVSRETAPGTLSLTGELFDLRHAYFRKICGFSEEGGFCPPMTKSRKDFKMHAVRGGFGHLLSDRKKVFLNLSKALAKQKDR